MMIKSVACNTKYILRQIAILVLVFSVLGLSCGCVAFRRKFVRKKKSSDQAIEMILEPEDYSDFIQTSEDSYREQFKIYSSWHSELINSLEREGNYKKQKQCADETVKNLKKVSLLLLEEKREVLKEYIKNLEIIKSTIEASRLSVDTIRILKFKLENLRLQIDREFVYTKVKDYLL